MAYTVLARKYRSQSFDDVIGQEAISQTLKNAIRTKRVAHAYLFTGTRGVGKTTMARILAKALNCLKYDEPTESPCCKCESCIAVNIGEDIDVIEIDGASNNGVEEVRRLRENAIYRPARARYKIYIIDEVHMLSTSAFNALLKILEEPPDHVKFIFATTDPNKVIATIQSRCQRFDFSNINVNKIAEQLRKILESEKIKYEDDLVVSVARMANGSMRDGLSLLDRLIAIGKEPLNVDLIEQFLGCPNSQKIAMLVKAVSENDAAAVLRSADDLLSGGLSEVQLVDALVDFMRDLMIVKSAGADSDLLILTSQQRQIVNGLSGKFDLAAIVYSITALEKNRWTIKNSETARALLETLLLRLTLSEHFLNIEQLANTPVSGESKTVKKKPITNSGSEPILQNTNNSAAETASLPAISDINAIKENWNGIVEAIAAELGGATAGLLKRAEPLDLNDSVFTIALDSASKLLCQSNGRLEQIQSVLSRHFSKQILLKLQTAEQDKNTGGQNRNKTSSQKRNEILNDPAVRTVLTGLGARVVNIED
ncbi:MAG: DNA polymerase III subunit gamma/tau [Phycisphaerae bacterium]